MTQPNTLSTGRTAQVTHLHIAPRSFLPMKSMPEVEIVAGKGIVGDRYMLETGFYSDKPEPGRQITFFESETLEALRRDFAIELAEAEHRRNVTTRGVPLNHLVGRRFQVGDLWFEGTRLSFPCKHIEEITGKAIFNALVHRCGLNAVALKSGVMRCGDAITLA